MSQIDASDTPLDDFSRLRQALHDRYTITGVVGAGGMAVVYRARDLKHNRDVAIKVLRSDLSRAIGGERFLREIEILAALQHPRILPLYDSGNADGFLYYVMPLVEGESLRQRMHREGQLPLDDALRIAREVASALAYAHARGIVHRDIKPDNILLSGGEAVVADFGIARALDVAGGTRITMAGVAVGTPVYMSPEQVSTEGEVDARSDIYSLGCLLYEMIAGRPPYAAPSTERLLMQHIAAPVPQLSALEPTVPIAVDRVIQRALAKSPDDRFATAGQFADALLTAPTVSNPAVPRVDGDVSSAAWPVPTTSRDGMPSAGAPVAVRSTWRRAPLIGALVAVLGVVAALVWRREQRPALDAAAIAVLPFRVSGDSSLAFLREGMVDLITTQLGSTAGMRPVDSRTVLAAWRRAVRPGTDPSIDQARRLAERLGSGRFVLGEVVGAGTGVAITARVIDAAGERRAEASVQGAKDSLYLLVDRLTSQLLAGSAGEPARRIVELTSTSLPAVRAYLEGRAAFRRAENARAIERFTEALSLDSTFALAALGMASAGAWSQQAGQSAALARGLRTGYALRNRLSARDRLLFEAYVLPNTSAPLSAAQQLAAWRRAAEGAPESAEVHFEYGDRLYHAGVQLGIPEAQTIAATAFARAVSLDSSYAPPLAHLVELAARSGDRERTRRLDDLYKREASAADAGDYVRWRVALTLDDTRTLEAVRTGLEAIAVPALNRIIGYGQADGASLRDVDLAAAELQRRVEAGIAVVSNVPPGLTLRAWARNRGRPADAARALEWLRAAEPMTPGTSIVYLEADQLPVLDALFWDGDRTEAMTAAGRLAARVSLPPPADSWERARYYTNACVLGLWQLTAAVPPVPVRPLEVLRAGARSHDSAVVHGADSRLCLTMLEAIDADARALPSRRALSTRLDSLLRDGPYVFGADFGNLLVARLLERQGDRAAAVAALRRRPYDWDTAPLYLTTYLREEGRVAALLGDGAGAAAAYDRFLALHDGADTAARARAEEVRRARTSLATPSRRS